MRDPGNEVEESHVSQTNRVFLKRGLQPHRGSCLLNKRTLVLKRAAPNSGLLCVPFLGGGEGLVYFDLEESGVALYLTKISESNRNISSQIRGALRSREVT